MKAVVKAEAVAVVIAVAAAVVETLVKAELEWRHQLEQRKLKPW